MIRFDDYCVDIMLKSVPEIKQQDGEIGDILDKHFKMGMEANEVYETVVAQYIANLINKEHKTNEDENILKRCFDCVENIIINEKPSIKIIY